MPYRTFRVFSKPFRVRLCLGDLDARHPQATPPQLIFSALLRWEVPCPIPILPQACVLLSLSGFLSQEVFWNHGRAVRFLSAQPQDAREQSFASGKWELVDKCTLFLSFWRTTLKCFPHGFLECGINGALFDPPANSLVTHFSCSSFPVLFPLFHTPASCHHLYSKHHLHLFLAKPV